MMHEIAQRAKLSSGGDAEGPNSAQRAADLPKER